MSDMSRKEAISILKKLKLDAEEYGKESDFVKQAVEAFDTAIASLETDEAYQLEYEKPELCEDYISRKEAISWIENLRTLNEHYHPNAKDNNLIDCDSAIDHLKQVPSVLPKEPTTKNDHHRQNIQAYAHDFGVSKEQAEKELRVTTKNDLGVDCVSRAQAQTKIEMNASRYTIARERGGMGQVEWSDQLIKVSDAVDIIRNLPSVTLQEPRKGEWLRMSDLSEQEDDRYKCSCCGNVVHYTNKINLYTFNNWCGRCGSDNGIHIHCEVEK